MISIDNDQIMIEHYQTLGHVDDHQITVIMKQYHLEIRGRNLSITALSKYEIMIHGHLESVGFAYES